MRGFSGGGTGPAWHAGDGKPRKFHNNLRQKKQGIATHLKPGRVSFKNSHG